MPCLILHSIGKVLLQSNAIKGQEPPHNKIQVRESNTLQV